MSKIKVSTLTGALLNYWVAKAEGLNVDMPEPDPEFEFIYIWRDYGCTLPHGESGSEDVFDPVNDWSDAGPIIEREKIGPIPRIDDTWYAEVPMEIKQDGVFQVGPTPLIATMRCFVASKFGEEVDDE